MHREDVMSTSAGEIVVKLQRNGRHFDIESPDFQRAINEQLDITMHLIIIWSQFLSHMLLLWHILYTM